MNENPGLNLNSDDFAPYQADDALRTVVFEPVAIGDGQHYSWPSSTSPSRSGSRSARYAVLRCLSRQGE